eukprot:Colp12_sorted_trinity150504_noHs@15721
MLIKDGQRTVLASSEGSFAQHWLMTAGARKGLAVEVEHTGAGVANFTVLAEWAEDNIMDQAVAPELMSDDGTTSTPWPTLLWAGVAIAEAAALTALVVAIVRLVRQKKNPYTRIPLIEAA